MNINSLETLKLFLTISEQMSHQAVAPGFQASGFVRAIRSSLESEDVDKLAQSILHGIEVELSEIANRMRTMRTDHQSVIAKRKTWLCQTANINDRRLLILSEELNKNPLNAFLSDAYDNIKEQVSVFLDVSYRLEKLNIKGISSKIDWARRRIQFFKRIIRRLHYTVAGRDKYFVSQLGIQRNTQIAFENANEAFPKALIFDRVVRIESDDLAYFSTLRSDYDRFIEILTNLFENSIKYHGNPDDLRIKLKAFKTVPEALLSRIEADSIQIDRSNYISFSISDNGPGISSRLREKIFESGYREKIYRDTVKGGGFGLHYVRRLVNELGGRIYCVPPSSYSLNGAHFVFTIRKFTTHAEAEAGLAVFASS